MRVTGGVLGGRVLRAPSSGLRPTADRVREAIFSRLDVTAAVVLDLYAGSGSLGIESISRGASSVVFIERAARCVSALRANLEKLELEDVATVVAGEVVQALRRSPVTGQNFDLVFLDPPYASGEAQRALESLVEAKVLASGGVVVLEAGRRHPVPPPSGLDLLDERVYGETLIARFVAP